MTTAAGPELSDEHLLAVFADATRSASAREAAFRALVARYRRRVFGVCFRILGDPADAEDATQETLIRLARGAHGFRGDAKLSTWLYRVAHNVCTDRVRYERRRPATPVDDLVTLGLDPGVDDGSEHRAITAVLATALGQLDELSRQLLLLVAVEELSYAEAAEATGLPVGTVKSRVSRARVKLGELLAVAEAEPRPSRSWPASDRHPGGGAEPASPGPRGPPGP